MYAVRINDLIDDGDLVIPFSKIKQLNHKSVEVIILPMVENDLTENKNSLDKILKKYKNVTPYRDIEDAVSWQKKNREEW